MTITAAQLQEFLGDRYTIRQPLGGGSMSLVFAADDLRHGRPVAIKVLLPDYVATLAAERFNREIQIAARLQHPHIVPLLDSGETHGVFYLVMPLIEGETLRARLVREGRLPVRDVLRILADVADALAYAHRKGIIHRDIKPDNILLAGRHALVADFGVAKAVSEALGADRNLTGGVALGTPAYMAPEQATADPALDHRVDVYAFGILGYELLAGRPPFDGDTPHEILTAQVLSAPPPIETHRPDAPPALASLLMRCLAKSPAERWAGIEELQGPLEGLATPTSGVTPVATAPVARAFGKPALAAAAAAVLVMAGAAYVALRDPAVAVLPSLTQRQLTFEGTVTAAAPSPGGDLLAYVSETPSGAELRVRDLRGGAPLTLITERDIGAPNWSADGAELRFDALDSTRRWGHYVIPRLGGARRQVSNLEGAALSPDGQWLARFPSGSRRLQLLSQTTGESLHHDLKGYLWHSDPAVSPTSPTVAFSAASPAERKYSLLVAAPPTLQPVVVLQDTVALGMPAWGPDGRTLYYLRSAGALSDLLAVRLTERGRPAGGPTVVASGLAAEPEYIRQLEVSRDGRQVVYVRRERSSNLALVSRGSPARPAMERLLTMGSALYRTGRLAPDGRTIAYLRDASGAISLELQPVGGGPPRTLAVRTSILDIAWSADGSRIAASVGEASARPGVEVFPMEGGAGLLYPGIRPGASLAWLGDSLVLVTGEGNRRLWRIPLNGAPPSPLPGVDSLSWVFFPQATADGRTLHFYQNHGEGNRGITELELGTGRSRPLQRGVFRLLRERPDGGGVYLTDFVAASDSARLWLAPADGAPLQLIAAYPRGADILDLDPVRGTVLLNLRDTRADAWAIELHGN